MHKRNILVVTGGAGFVGSNLIEYLLKKTNYRIISLDDYSTGNGKNHISSKVKYIFGNTQDIATHLKRYKNKIHSIFHFGEFARIHQSFEQFDECFASNSIGSKAVFKFCLDNNIKLIYSATSAALGNNGDDSNLSPYAFMKANNLRLLENLKKWYGFKFEVVYFYNVYGPRQIKTGPMATVIRIFENAYEKQLPITVVKPGTQTRRFTHINDTVDVCYRAWRNNKSKHYIISNKESFSILEVATMFGNKIKYLPQRRGERNQSAIAKTNLNNNIDCYFGKTSLIDYINNFKNKHK